MIFSLSALRMLFGAGRVGPALSRVCLIFIVPQNSYFVKFGWEWDCVFHVVETVPFPEVSNLIYPQLVFRFPLASTFLIVAVSMMGMIFPSIPLIGLGKISVAVSIVIVCSFAYSSFNASEARLDRS